MARRRKGLIWLAAFVAAIAACLAVWHYRKVATEAVVAARLSVVKQIQSGVLVPARTGLITLPADQTASCECIEVWAAPAGSIPLTVLFVQHRYKGSNFDGLLYVEPPLVLGSHPPALLSAPPVNIGDQLVQFHRQLDQRWYQVFNDQG